MHGESGNGDVPRQEDESTTGPEGARLEEAEEQLDVAILEIELADLRDRSARTLADFDNYRKRIERERRDERRYGALALAIEVVDVVDNLERALEAGGDVGDLKAGVEMTLRQMEEVLGRHDIHRVPAVGELFDPNLHSAVSQHPDAGVSAPTVSAELRPGYKLHERLVRPAMVTVAQPIVEPVDEEGAES